MNLQDTHEEVATALAHLARLFAPHCKLSFVMRSPKIEDGDMLVTDDDPALVIAAIQKLSEREKRVLGRRSAR